MLIKSQHADYKCEYRSYGKAGVDVLVYKLVPNWRAKMVWKQVSTHTPVGGIKYAEEALEDFRNAVRAYEQENKKVLKHNLMEKVVHLLDEPNPPPKKP